MSQVQPPDNETQQPTVVPGTPDPAPPVSSPADVAPPETAPAAPSYIANTDAPQTNDTPFTEPQLPKCPSCKIGLLYPIAWDDKALHEVGQPIYAPAMLSGGSVTARCFNCDYMESFAMNPQVAPPNPNPGA